jgi:hypothetical protein
MQATDFVVARNDYLDTLAGRIPPDQGHMLSLTA